MKKILSTLIVILIAQIFCKYETPPGYANSEQSQEFDGEIKDDLNLDMDMPDIPDMNFIEKVKVAKKEPNANEYYLKNPGYMDGDKMFAKIPSFNKNTHQKFRFAQTNSPIDNEFLNQLAGSNDPLKPAPHYEEVRKRDTSNGILLSNRRRTVNFETGSYPQFFSDLRKD